ncbi:MAG: Na/Pi symporter [Endomicrobia bacterium]|nr:Na/Pi symporter [Endomicrobiia bacterium]MCL2507077.1 Na/Pi symporter [Endomicrobiia bacterium]
MKNKIIALLFIFFISAVSVFAMEKTLYSVSGDDQTGIRGYPLKNEYVVRIVNSDGSPAEGVAVKFSKIRSANEGLGKNTSYVSQSEALTDEDGYAKTKLVLGKTASEEINVVAFSDDVPGSVIFNTRAFNKNWLVMMLLNLAGGLALLLFGMTFINDALQRAAGQKFRSILTYATSSKIRGVISGFSLTCLNQSSSATMLFAISLISGGIMSFYQSMAVSLGASIGSTITAQLVAFRLVNYALLIIAAGYVISFVSGGKRLSKVGDAIFGFGLLFFGMKLMSDAMIPLTLNPVFLDFIAAIKSPLFAISAGVAMTLIIQSSGAFVGIIIALAASGILTLEQAICLALGSQIGTCITVVIGALRMPRSAKRAVIWQIVHQTIAVILVFPFLQIVSFNGQGVWLVFIKGFTETLFFTQDIGRQIAMSHTLVVVLNMLILLPFLKYFQKIVFFFYPFRNSEISFGTVYIDIKNPEHDVNKALVLSKLEIQRLGEFVSEMLTNSVKALKTRNIDIPESISNKALKTDILYKEIVPYLAKIGQSKLSSEQSKKEIQLLYVLDNLDEIADIIDRNLMYTARKKIRSFSRFSEEGLEDIKKIHGVVCENMVRVMNAFSSEDEVLAEEVAALKARVRLLTSELKQKHIARLHANLQESIETSGFHMDILDQYARINSMICDIGEIISREV